MGTPSFAKLTETTLRKQLKDGRGDFTASEWLHLLEICTDLTKAQTKHRPEGGGGETLADLMALDGPDAYPPR